MFRHRLELPDGTVLESGAPSGRAISKVTLTEEANNNEETDLMPGAAAPACLEVELLVPDGDAGIAPGTECKLWRVSTETNAAELLGVFCVAQTAASAANRCRLTAYDRMTLLDKDLSPWLRARQGQFPMTLRALVEAVCTQCGVTLADGALDGARNRDYAVQAFYADGLTGRRLIQWAAQAMGRFARMDPAGDLEFAWYEDYVEYSAGPGQAEAGAPLALGLSGPVLGTADGKVWTLRLPQRGYFQGGLSYEEYETAPIDKVQIKQSDDDVGVIYPPDETGTNALVIQGNLLLTTASADALRPVAQALYEQLHGVTYTPLEVTLPLTADAPAPGKIITVTDAYGRMLQTRVMQRKVSGQRVTLTATGNARRDSTAAVNSQTYQNLQGRMLELSTSVDGLKVTASELQGDYAQLELTVDGISTEVSNVQGDMTSLEQTVDGLELTVVKDGEVRTAFAADSTSVTINSGRITFSGNTLVVNSQNFRLTDDGTVSITGDFYSSDGTNQVEIKDGLMRIWRKISDGSQREAATIAASGANAALGNLYLLGPGANGGQVWNVTASSGWRGGSLCVYNASQQLKFQVQINGNGDAEVWVNGVKRF